MTAAIGPEHVTRKAGAHSAIVRVGVGIISVLTLAAISAPLLAPHDPSERAGRPFARPSREHWLGTDDVGHDLFSQVLYGCRVSLLIGFGAASVAILVGVLIGAVAGYRRGWLDATLMRLVDVTLALPFLPLLIVVGAFLGGGWVVQMFVIALVMWAPAARAVRAQVLSVRELDHVAAARSMGGRTIYVIIRHIVPEIAPLIVAKFVLFAGVAILTEASLSFLGLGDPTAQSWGTILYFAQARSAFITDAWLWWVVPPGVGIAATVVGLSFIGFGLEERGQPSLRHRRRRLRTPVEPVGDDVADDAPVDAPLLHIEGLSVSYEGSDVLAVRGVTMTVERGEIVGVVGESGSGKTTLVAAMTDVVRAPAEHVRGRVRLVGRDLGQLSAEELRQLRGDRVALVPQNAMTSLNPVHRLGDQIAEAIEVHRPIRHDDALARADELLELVGIPAHRSRSYPHEFSGGMRQRVVIAMALANDPELLIADEPTTGLDVVVAQEVLALLTALQRRLGLAMVVVSHDLPAITQVASRLVIMRHGEIVEQGPTASICTAPTHPYTRALLASVPRLRCQADHGVLEPAQ